jgi:hypothetical protein
MLGMSGGRKEEEEGGEEEDEEKVKEKRLAVTAASISLCCWGPSIHTGSGEGELSSFPGRKEAGVSPRLGTWVVPPDRGHIVSHLTTQ